MENELSGFESAKNAARDKGCEMTLQEAVEYQSYLAAVKEKLSSELALINAEYDVFRMEVVPGKMDEEGIERITYEGIGRVSLTADMFVQTTDKSGLFNWLGDNGLGDIIQPVINASTLKAFIKGRIKAGKEYPEEFVRVTPFTRASITQT